MKKMLMVAALSAVAGGFVTRAFAEPQPHMRAALGSLETALNQLEKASADKGGHRVKAMELIKGAIVEVKLGIDFDNKH